MSSSARISRPCLHVRMLVDLRPDRVRLLLGGGEHADPEPLGELAEQLGVGGSELGQQHHQRGDDGGQRRRLAGLAAPQGGDLGAVVEQHRLDVAVRRDPSGTGAAGCRYNASQEHERTHGQFMNELGDLGIDLDVLGLVPRLLEDDLLVRSSAISRTGTLMPATLRRRVVELDAFGPLDEALGHPDELQSVVVGVPRRIDVVRLLVSWSSRSMVRLVVSAQMSTSERGSSLHRANETCSASGSGISVRRFALRRPTSPLLSYRQCARTRPRSRRRCRGG